MNHEPEFRSPVNIKDEEQKRSDLAACYVRVFLGSDDGKRVLAHLREQFSPDRPRFVGAHPDAYRAAIVDGQCFVMKTIEDALKLGHRGQGLSQP